MRYQITFDDSILRWVVIDNQTGGEMVFDWVSEAEEYASDMNAVEDFEYAMAAYSAE